MKPTINKSRLMKDAHRMRKYDGYEMSIALKLAWLNEKKKVQAELVAYLWSWPSGNYVAPTQEELYAAMANFNTNYYANNRYNGD